MKSEMTSFFVYTVCHISRSKNLDLTVLESTLGNGGFSAIILGMTDHLYTLVSNALRRAFWSRKDVPFVIEHPKDMAHGDYATNAALGGSETAGSESCRRSTQARGVSE
jgi:hypothetical protein